MGLVHHVFSSKRSSPLAPTRALFLYAPLGHNRSTLWIPQPCFAFSRYQSITRVTQDHYYSITANRIAHTTQDISLNTTQLKTTRWSELTSPNVSTSGTGTWTRRQPSTHCSWSTPPASMTFFSSLLGSFVCLFVACYLTWDISQVDSGFAFPKSGHQALWKTIAQVIHHLFTTNCKRIISV